MHSQCSRARVFFATVKYVVKKSAAGGEFRLQDTFYTGSGATKKYMTIKWQALPSITKIWKISCDPKFLCLESKSGTFSA